MMLRCHRVVFLLLFLCCWTEGVTLRLAAAESAAPQNAPVFAPATNGTAAVESNAAPRFNVVAYTVEGGPLLSTNILTPMLSKHTGTNVGLEEIVKAASDLQLEYWNQGYPAMSVAFAREQITNGIVTLNVAQTAVPQIMVSGIRYYISTNNTEVIANPSAVEATTAPESMAASAAATNAVPPAINYPTVPASPEEMARARVALFQKMAELAAATNAVPLVINYPTVLANREEMAGAQAALLQKMTELNFQEKDKRVHVVSTNAGPKFDVEKYLVAVNSVLSPEQSPILTALLAQMSASMGFVRWWPNFKRRIATVVT
jgi:hypothetical protein